MERLTPLSLGSGGGATPRHGGPSGAPGRTDTPPAAGAPPTPGSGASGGGASAPGLHAFGGVAMAGHSAFDDLGAALTLRDTWPLFESSPTSGVHGLSSNVPPGQ